MRYFAYNENMKIVMVNMKAAIFDLDGTILDSMPMWQQFDKRYLGSLGIEAEKDLDRKVFHLTAEQSAQYFIDTYQIDKTVPEILSEIGEMALVFYQNEVAEKEGMTAFLEQLKAKGVHMAVATASSYECAHAGLVKNQLLDYFETIVTVSDVGVGKDQPDVFEEAARRLGVPIEKSYVFEDALHATETAKKAGFKVIGVREPTNDYFEEELRNTCDFFLKSYFDQNDVFDFMGLD